MAASFKLKISEGPRTQIMALGLFWLSTAVRGVFKENTAYPPGPFLTLLLGVDTASPLAEPPTWPLH